VTIELSSRNSSYTRGTTAAANLGVMLTLVPNDATASAVDAGYDLACLNNQEYMIQVEPSEFTNITVPKTGQFYSPQEASQILFDFISKLAISMKPAPVEVHREVSRRPWDFV
jgi:hypothetical protein